MSKVSVGQTVPDFEATATGDRIIRLSDLRGQNVILYFYPKDHTPGCTQEGLDLKAHYTEIQALNTVVFGVSRDSLRTHENFKAKQGFPFDLLADTDEALCQLFDVIELKNMYGQQRLGVERSTFLMDSQGQLVFEWRKVKVKGHVEAILQQLRQLAA